MEHERTAEDVLGERTQPGAQGAGLGGGFESGAEAGKGAGPVRDVDDSVAARRLERSDDGPAGTQDTSRGDLAEAGADTSSQLDELTGYDASGAAMEGAPPQDEPAEGMVEPASELRADGPGPVPADGA